MESVLVAREKIYNHIQDAAVCRWSDCAIHDDYVTYCVAKDTIQDTAEALIAHRSKGFVDDICERYIGYYGVLQAVYMQQDAIYALYRLFVGVKLDISYKPSWKRVRDLRNETVGHPVGQKRFLNRSAIDYDHVNYLWWPESSRFPQSEDVPLASLIDAYAVEAADVLESVHTELEAACAVKHT